MLASIVLLSYSLRARAFCPSFPLHHVGVGNVRMIESRTKRPPATPERPGKALGAGCIRQFQTGTTQIRPSSWSQSPARSLVGAGSHGADGERAPPPAKKKKAKKRRIDELLIEQVAPHQQHACPALPRRSQNPETPPAVFRGSQTTRSTQRR